jgi:myosin heavy subunit
MVQEEGPRRVATVANVSDSHEFDAVKKGLALFGMSEEAIGNVLRIVCAVALLGNVVFKPQEGLDREVS